MQDEQPAAVVGLSTIMLFSAR